MKRTLLVILTCLAVMTIKAQDQKIYTSDDAAKYKSITPPVFKLYADEQLLVTDPVVGNLPYEAQWFVMNYRKPTDVPARVDVQISYIVEKDGKLSNIQINKYRPEYESITTPPSSFKSEIRRLLGSMKKWTPAKKQGRAIRFKMESSLYLFDYAKAIKEKVDYYRALKEDEDSEKKLEESNKNKVYDFVEELPSFPGGLEAMFEWIQRNQKKPEGDPIGRCILNFVVEKDGSLSEVKVVRSSGNEKLDEESIRLVKSMPRWNPGKQNGENVRCRYSLPVSFI
jgi:TonB family protein